MRSCEQTRCCLNPNIPDPPLITRVLHCVQVAPLPTARSSAESPLREILTEFAVEEDAVSKVQLLVKYAHMLPHMSESDQTAANRVMGCTTQVLPPFAMYAHDIDCSAVT